MGCTASSPAPIQSRIIAPEPSPRRLSLTGGPNGAKQLGVKDDARRRRLSVTTTPSAHIRLLQENTSTARNLSTMRKPHGSGFHAKSLPIVWGEYTRPGNDPLKNVKENQDSFVVHDCFGNNEDHMFIGVFDGHGPNGAMASQFVRDSLPQSLLNHLQSDELYPAIHQSCVDTNVKLSMSHIDVYVSGSTCCSAFLQGDTLYAANVGDSRAVLARELDGEIRAIEITNDHKPDRSDEMARIVQHGGRVFEWGVPRVWLKDVDMPGLAMSRSFGDLAAESVGVFAEPELSEVRLCKADKFAVWASDGVWEFITSQECVDIVAGYLDKGPQAACAALVAESVRRWNEEEDVVDDTTAIILFFDYGHHSTTDTPTDADTSTDATDLQNGHVS